MKDLLYICIYLFKRLYTFITYFNAQREISFLTQYTISSDIKGLMMVRSYSRNM